MVGDHQVRLPPGYENLARQARRERLNDGRRRVFRSALGRIDTHDLAAALAEKMQKRAVIASDFEHPHRSTEPFHQLRGVLLQVLSKYWRGAAAVRIFHSEDALRRHHPQKLTMSPRGAYRHGKGKRVLPLPAFDELARHEFIGQRSLAKVEHHLRRVFAETAVGARAKVFHGYSLRSASAYSRVRNGTRTTSASC